MGAKDSATWRCVEISRELGSILNFSNVSEKGKLTDNMVVMSDNMLSGTGDAASLDDVYSHLCYVTKAQQKVWD